MPTAILVDDMPQAIEVLKSDLNDKCPDVDIIGTADSVVNAAKLLRKKQPDLLFLDIMLGDGTGFDLLEIFPDISSKIIFVTAYEEHAIKAFRFSAIDYLLKPINPTDLEKAVARAKQTLKMASSKESIDILKETINDPDSLPKRISLSTQEKIAVVEIENIIRCESDGNNTMFTFKSGERIFVTRTLKQFDQMFSEHTFIRTHQSHLINTAYIQEYVRRDGGYIKMKNGDRIPVSVRKKSAVIEMLDNL
jgi:two-component system LytT family response regulator